MSTESQRHPHELLSALVDGALTPAEQAMVDAHLRDCAACRALLGDLRRLAMASASEAPPAPPADLQARIRWRLRAVGVQGKERGRRWLAPLPLSAAAGLVVALGVIWLLRDASLTDRGATEVEAPDAPVGSPAVPAPVPSYPAEAAAAPPAAGPVQFEGAAATVPPEPGPRKPQAQPPAARPEPSPAAPAPAPAEPPASAAARRQASRYLSDKALLEPEAPKTQTAAPAPEPSRERTPEIGRDVLALAPGVTAADGDGGARSPEPEAKRDERSAGASTEGAARASAMQQALQKAAEEGVAGEGAAAERSAMARIVDRPAASGRSLFLDRSDYRVQVWENGVARLSAAGYRCEVLLGAGHAGDLAALFQRAFPPSAAVTGGPPAEPSATREGPRADVPAGSESEFLRLVGGPSLERFRERCGTLPPGVPPAE